MEISLEELMGCEFFLKSKIIAGKSGIDNIVTHVTTLDSPDAYNYFKGGEFVITTGYSFINDIEYQKDLIKKLVSKGVVGIGITLRYFNNVLPECIKHDADVLNFPVISIPDEASYSDIYEFITSNLVSKTTREIKRLNEVYKEFGQSLQRKGFPGIVESLYKWSGLQAIILINNKIYAYPEDPTLEFFPLNSDEWKQKAFQNSANYEIECFSWGKDDKYLEWICSKIVFNDKMEGYILLLKRFKYKYVSRDTCMLLDYSAFICSYEVSSLKAIAETQRKYKNEFVRNCLLGELSILEIKKQAEVLDYYLQNRGYILLIKGIEEKCLNKIVNKIYTTHTLCGMLEEDLAVVFVDDGAKYQDKITSLYNECSSCSSLERIIIGIGNAASLENIKQSYEEAKSALEIGCCLQSNPSIYYFSKLGFYQLLKISDMSKEMERYCENYLEPLEKLGEENYACLIKTLQCFIKNSFSYRETATDLFVHQNTVRYRITTIEKLCKIDFGNADDRLNMEVTLKILPFIKK